MDIAKPILQSKTIWGIFATVLVSLAAPTWKGYRDSGDWQGAIDNALPALVTLVPASFASYGRIVAKKEVRIK